MTDLVRVQQILSGNTSAFSYFVEAYQGMAITIAYRICGNMQDAEDVVQESYIKAYRNLHTFRGGSKFSTWFYRIVYNTAVTLGQTKARLSDAEVPSLGIESADSNAEHDMESADTAEQINSALKKMPSGDALLLTLYYMEENPVKEIAKIMGLNESNVKVRLFRARKLFRELVSKEINPTISYEEVFTKQ